MLKTAWKFPSSLLTHPQGFHKAYQV
jgi:hypothetical protein